MAVARNRYEEICDLIAIQVGCGATRTASNRYFRAFYKLFLQQLKMNKKFMIPKFGTFEVKKRKERKMVVGDPVNGGTKLIYVEPRYYITFTPSSYLDTIINYNDFEMYHVDVKAENIKNRNTKDEDIPMNKTLVDMLNKAKERTEK